jgi:hypothetical protein
MDQSEQFFKPCKGRFFNPEGIGSSSPGLARPLEGLPWVEEFKSRNPERVENRVLMNKMGSSTLSVDPYTKLQGLGSATVPVAVFGVPPNKFLRPFDPTGRNREEVGRGTHPTASETLALPRPDPLKTSKKHKMQPFQGCDLSQFSPGVARSSQPWADRFNPFRVEVSRNSSPNFLPHSAEYSEEPKEVFRKSACREDWL